MRLTFFTNPVPGASVRHPDWKASETFSTDAAPRKDDTVMLHGERYVVREVRWSYENSKHDPSVVVTTAHVYLWDR